MTTVREAGRRGRPIISPVDQPQRYPYQPALDGVRAVAVAGVVLFHFGDGIADGGFLGVDLFLALSGFLITTLLLREFAATRSVALGAFYGRRARRLLPAMLLVLGTVALFGRLAADSIQLVRLRGDLLSSLFYVANWRFIAGGDGYFEQFGSPSPVSHLWSLAIEEQWYLVWPLVVVGLLAVLGPPLGRRRGLWIGLTIGLAATSALLMTLLVDESNVNRAYYGTDTRAQTLLVGAALAMLFHGRSFSRSIQRRLDILGLLGLAGFLALYWLIDAADVWMYQGGFLVVACGATLMIAGAAGAQHGVTQRILSLPPLPELGRISYGVYLWHWPVLVYLDERRTGLSGASLFTVRATVTLLIALASYELVERPVRERRWRARQGMLASIGAIAAIALVVVTLVPVSPSPAELLARAEATPNVEGGAPVPRIGVVGDSVALDIAYNYPRDVLGVPASLKSGAIVGCGLPAPVAGFQGGTPCRDVFKVWRRLISRYDPDVTVVGLGVWELSDRDAAARGYRFGSPSYARYLTRRLSEGLGILTSRGGHVALLNIPCYNSPSGQIAHSSPDDTSWLNRVLRAAARASSKVRIIDYASWVCSGSEEAPGLSLRRDGVHPSPAGALAFWRWLAPQLVLTR